MHVPQIWFVRYSSENRRLVRPPSEHRQREDLRVPLVLVHPVGGSDRFGAAVPLGCRLGIPSKDVPVEGPSPSGASQRSRIGRPQVPDW